MNDDRILILTVVAIGISCFVLGFNVGKAYGENYNYNMTQEEQEQLTLSELCYVMKGDLTIGTLDDFCKMAYGGINSKYGEAIK